jgi:hypothetical protein
MAIKITDFEFYNGYNAPEPVAAPQKKNAVTRAFHALNTYFFDVEPDEPIDWASCAIFYGFIVFGSIALTALLLLQPTL